MVSVLNVPSSEQGGVEERSARGLAGVDNLLPFLWREQFHAPRPLSGSPNRTSVRVWHGRLGLSLLLALQMPPRLNSSSVVGGEEKGGPCEQVAVPDRIVAVQWMDALPALLKG